MALAGAFAVSCVDNAEPFAIYDPSAVVAPTVGSIEGATLASDGTPLTLSYTAVDYGVKCATTYTLYASDTEDFTKVEKVTASIGGGNITITQANLNTNILNLGGAADTEFTIYLRLSAWMANDKSAGIAKTLAVSNVTSAVFTPYSVLLLDKDVYGHVWVQGDYCGWDHSKSQFLYDYSKDENTYEGVVDFGTAAANGIKFTGADNWDAATGNWGSEAQAEEAEASSVKLINGDASKNIICYSKRFYYFSLNKAKLTVTKVWGADKISIIGLGNDWDTDIDMTYNADFVRFYADIDVASATSFKFRADGAWTYNWGYDCELGGDNIPVEAGQYRVYLDLNKKTVTLSTSMYGKDEPKAAEPEPEPVPNVGWGIIGVGGNWDTDISMTENDGVWTGFATLTDTDEFKFRKDGAWTEAYGGVFAALDKPFEAVADNGANIKVGAAGFYKIVLDTKAVTITISSGDVWSVIGAISGSSWDKDFFMTKTDAGLWVYEGLTIEDKAEFKLRRNAAWDIARGGVFKAVGEAFAVSADGTNITGVPAGTYTLTYDPSKEELTLSDAAKYWSVIGVNDDWNTDYKMTEVAPGIWVSSAIDVSKGGWKIRYAKDWGVNRGGETPSAPGAFVEAVLDGGNLSLTGKVIVVYNANNETIGTLVWGVVGGIASIDGFNWNGDIPMNLGSDGKFYSVPIALKTTDQIKIRKDAAWTTDRGGTCAAADAEFDAAAGGANIAAPADGTYMVVYDPAKEKLTLSTNFWGAVGEFNSWGNDVFLMFDGANTWSAFNKTIAGGWKLRKSAAWSVDRGGVYASAGTPFAAAQGGANITVGDLTSFDIIYDSKAETITAK